MRKLFLVLLLISLPFPAWSLSPVFLHQVSSGSAAAADYSDITFWWRCESDNITSTNGTLDYSAGDCTATLNSAAAINTDDVKHNTNGLDCPGAGDYAAFTVSSDDIVDADEFRIGVWYYRTTYADSSYVLFINKDASNRTRIYIYSTDGIFWDWEDGGTTRTNFTIDDADLDATTWYFIEFACKVSTNYREVFVDGVSKGTSSAEIGTFAPDLFQIGNMSAQANDFYFDELKISNDSTRDFNALKAITSYPGN